MSKIALGVSDRSEIYFAAPSAKAKKFYYKALSVGHFYCNDKYYLKRDRLDSILLVYVIDGAFTFRSTGGELQTAKKNDLVVINCYESHEYFTESNVEFMWVHIDGPNAKEICKEIIDTDGNLLRSAKYKSVKENVYRIFNDFKGVTHLSEHELSTIIYEVLMELLNPIKAKDENLYEENVSAAKSYILEHLNENISISALAKISNMSPTHFSRTFKRYTSFSPYEYVISVRLNKAKEYLLNTDMSISQIAFKTGFNSTANFIYCFTTNEGVSPSKFRKLQF